MSGRRAGFTLIELLVVIAIIAILAAILFPIFARAKQEANRTKCVSNLRQIGTAIHLYCDDNDGKYPEHMAAQTPPGFPTNGVMEASSNQLAGYAYTLYRYTKNTGIWMCPSGAKRKMSSSIYDVPPRVPTADTSFPMVSWMSAPGMPAISVNYASWPFNRPNKATPDSARGLTPAAFYEHHNRWHDLSKGDAMWSRFNPPSKIRARLIWDSYSTPNSKHSGFYAHKGGWNCLYYDGRAAWFLDDRSESR